MCWSPWTTRCEVKAIDLLVTGIVSLATLLAGAAPAAEPAPGKKLVEAVAKERPGQAQPALQDWEREVLAKMELLENLELLEDMELIEDLPVLRGEGGGS